MGTRWGDDWPLDRPSAVVSPLPSYRRRFDSEGPIPAEWRVERGGWAVRGGELRGERPEGRCAVVELAPLLLTGDWVVELYLRFPGSSETWAGLSIGDFAITLNPEDGRCRASRGDDFRTALLPTLGDEPFNPIAFHAIELRVRGGIGEVRVDGVRVLQDLPISRMPARLSLICDGQAAFDAVAVTLMPRGNPPDQIP